MTDFLDMSQFLCNLKEENAKYIIEKHYSIRKLGSDPYKYKYI